MVLNVASIYKCRDLLSLMFAVITSPFAIVGSLSYAEQHPLIKRLQ